MSAVASRKELRRSNTQLTQARSIGRLDRPHDRSMYALTDGMRELDRHVVEARPFESGAVVGHRECSRNATDLAAPLDALGVSQAILGDDIADAESVARA